MATTLHAPRRLGVVSKLNGVWHKRALVVLAAITVAHWAEHLLQAAQVWLLEHPRPEARGALGAVFPWLVGSEWLHYGYAVVMLVGLVMLLPAFSGRARTWWTAAIVIQLWHHAEHALLLYQAQAGHNLFGEPVPTSVVQLVLPRMELHLVYNAIVTVPMMVAMYLHSGPTRYHAARASCSCGPPTRIGRHGSPGSDASEVVVARGNHP